MYPFNVDTCSSSYFGATYTSQVAAVSSLQAPLAVPASPLTVATASPAPDSQSQVGVASYSVAAKD